MWILNTCVFASTSENGPLNLSFKKLFWKFKKNCKAFWYFCLFYKNFMSKQSVPPFLNNPPISPTPPFLEENILSPPLLPNLKNSIRPFVKRGVRTMVLCKRKKQSDWLSEFLGQSSIPRLLNYLKYLNQFAVSTDTYPYSKNQHHSSIKSWNIPDSILIITFGMSRCALQHIYTWTESQRCNYIFLATCKKSNS